VFAEKALNGLFDGALYGNPGQVMIQATAVGTAIVYSGAVSFVLLKLIGLFIPLRASVSDESTGLDITQHGEEAYLHTGGATPAMHQSKTAASVQPMFSPIKSDA
jgi:Amt family ammonium transporter